MADGCCSDMGGEKWRWESTPDRVEKWKRDLRGGDTKRRTIIKPKLRKSPKWNDVLKCASVSCAHSRPNNVFQWNYKILCSWKHLTLYSQNFVHEVSYTVYYLLSVRRNVDAKLCLYFWVT